MTTILVIEDEYDVLDNISNILMLEGFDVVTGRNGAEGVKQAIKHLPDLIICDVMMPELDGYGVLEQLQKDSSTHLIPFIFLTAKSARDSVRFGMNLGADDYITKPFAAKELLAAISSRLQKQSIVMQAYEARIGNLRKNLLTTLPHELRTPLTGVFGAGEILLLDADTIAPDDIREMASLVLQSGKRLHRLTENYLLYNRLFNLDREGKTWFTQLKDRGSTTLANVDRIARETAEEYSRVDDLVVTNTVDSRVHIYREYFQKVVVELIDNAFKFSDVGGQVIITTDVTPTVFRLTVSDSGIGMSAEQIQNIGGFVQFDRDQHEQQGLGMGLSIVKRLLEIHQGRFFIESELDKGTQVRVELPLSETLE